MNRSPRSRIHYLIFDMIIAHRDNKLDGVAVYQNVENEGEIFDSFGIYGRIMVLGSEFAGVMFQIAQERGYSNYGIGKEFYSLGGCRVFWYDYPVEKLHKSRPATKEEQKIVVSY